MNRPRLKGSLALVLTASLAMSSAPASAFDIEDYATTWRATRDAWLRALGNVRVALPRFLAIRMIAESHGRDVVDYEIALGSDLRTGTCDRWNVDEVGHPLPEGIPLSTFDYSGAFAFYGRSHGAHRAAQGGHHHHHPERDDLVGVTDGFLDSYDPLRWLDAVVPGASARTEALMASDIAWFEANGAQRLGSRCQVCEPCAPGEPCEEGRTVCLPEPLSGWCTWVEDGPLCTTEDGTSGHLREADCPAPVECDVGHCCPSGSTCGQNWWQCVAADQSAVEPVECPAPMTIEEALTYFEREEGYVLASQRPNMCVPEWWDYPPMDDIFTTYRANRDAILKALNELSLATPPYRAATAAYAAVVETYSANTPCGTWMLPNLPDLPNPFAAQAPN